MARLKEGEETKKKTYRCIVWVSRAVTPGDLAVLDTVKDLTIQQRVLVSFLRIDVISYARLDSRTGASPAIPCNEAQGSH